MSIGTTSCRAGSKDREVIRKIFIQGFKSLLDVDVELGKVNVFVGANGSGKSNLLEAIAMLSAAVGGHVAGESLVPQGHQYSPGKVSGYIDEGELVRRGLRSSSQSLLLPAFKECSRPFSIRLKAQGENASYEATLRPIGMVVPRWSVCPEGNESVTRDYETLQLLEFIDQYRMYSPSTNTLLGIVPEYPKGKPVWLGGGDIYQAASELLQDRSVVAKQVIDLIGWAESFNMSMPGDEFFREPPPPTLCFQDQFMIKDRLYMLFPLDVNEGAIHVLYVAALATLPSAPKFFAIDNFVHAMDPRLARAVMNHFCDWILSSSTDRQVLLASNNPFILDGLPLDNDDVRLFSVGRSRKGRTVVTRITVSEEELRRNGELWSVSRLFVMGHLGGMQDI